MYNKQKTCVIVQIVHNFQNKIVFIINIIQFFKNMFLIIKKIKIQTCVHCADYSKVPQ